MTSNFNKKESTVSDSQSLDELLRDVPDEKEKQRLAKAWHALGGLVGAHSAPPKPSKELEMIFRKNPNGSPVDEELTDDELNMLAAAGTPGETLTGDDGRNYLCGSMGDDTMDGEGGNDIMMGHGGDDVMDGGAGRDYMIGGAGDDSMDGGSGNDSMSGGSGNDYLNGGQGNDLLSGGSGNDTLIGGEGNDTLIGGEGGDVFVFNNNSGNDVISDFNPAEDRLIFEGMGSNDMSMVIENGNTIISYGNTTITLLGVELDGSSNGSTM